MKKMLILVFISLILVGCSSKKDLSCYKKDLPFQYGKMDRFISFFADNQGYIVSSTIKENRVYNNEEDAFRFLDENSEYTEKISDLELSYTQITKYDDKVLTKDIKRAMEAQEYECNYK